MQKEKFFHSTMKLFEDYRTKMVTERHKDYNGDFSNEVHQRLWQLSFICEKISYYDQVVTDPEITLSKSTNEEIIKLGKLFDEGIVYAEAFYSTAWRIILIADYYKKPLPGLKGLKKKAKGIRIVRNTIIVHPEDENIFIPSFGWGSNGPILKAAKFPGEKIEVTDKGLWVNAQEFKDSLEQLLQKAIK